MLAVVALSFCVLLLMRRSGRLLERLDKLASAAPPGLGLSLGDAFPDFQLPDLNGTQHSLAEYKGRRVLAVHWGADCGFCDVIAAELEAARVHLQAMNTELILMAGGDADTVRESYVEHQFTGTMLLMTDEERFRLFSGNGTPCAYLLNPNGAIERTMASGYVEVRKLLNAILSEAAPIATGPEPVVAGKQTPDFELEDLRGGRFSSTSLRGANALIVFTDPFCEPCDELAPQLVHFYQQHGAELNVVMIGRGPRDANEAKVSQFAIPVPFLLQTKWRVAKQFGNLSTPVAYLIGPDGRALADAAVGPGAIIDLARSGLRQSVTP